MNIMITVNILQHTVEYLHVNDIESSVSLHFKGITAEDFLSIQGPKMETYQSLRLAGQQPGKSPYQRVLNSMRRT